MERPQPTATDTPFSRASTVTLDDMQDAEKSSMPLAQAGQHISPQDEEKGAAELPPPPKSIVDVNDSLVQFDGPDDPEDPKNWSNRKRWAITLAMGLMTFVVSFPKHDVALRGKRLRETSFAGHVLQFHLRRRNRACRQGVSHRLRHINTRSVAILTGIRLGSRLLRSRV